MNIALELPPLAPPLRWKLTALCIHGHEQPGAAICDHDGFELVAACGETHQQAIDACTLMLWGNTWRPKREGMRADGQALERRNL